MPKAARVYLSSRVIEQLHIYVGEVERLTRGALIGYQNDQGVTVVVALSIWRPDQTHAETNQAVVEIASRYAAPPARCLGIWSASTCPDPPNTPIDTQHLTLTDVDHVQHGPLRLRLGAGTDYAIELRDVRDRRPLTWFSDPDVVSDPVALLHTVELVHPDLAGDVDWLQPLYSGERPGLVVGRQTLGTIQVGGLMPFMSVLVAHDPQRPIMGVYTDGRAPLDEILRLPQVRHPRRILLRWSLDHQRFTACTVTGRPLQIRYDSAPHPVVPQSPGMHGTTLGHFLDGET